MIKRSLSYALYGLFYGISLFPFWLLYLVSDGLSFILKDLVKYRRRVITNNLKTSFPDKSEDEIDLIRNQVYRNLGDLIVETIKMVTLSRKSIKKRYKIINPEVFSQPQFEKGAIVCAAHFNNWEWGALGLATIENFKAIVLYKPINNLLVDKMVFKIRSRFGAILTPKQKWLRTLVSHKSEKTLSVFIGDQKPAGGEKGNSILFMGRETPVIIGFEKAAKSTGYGVVYWRSERKKRGFYEITIKPIETEPNLDELALTKKYFSFLEEDINKDPAGWLWSHNRWNIKK